MSSLAFLLSNKYAWKKIFRARDMNSGNCEALQQEQRDTRKLFDKLHEAEHLYRDALEWTRKALGNAHPSTLASMINLANYLMREFRYVEAEPLYRSALAGQHEALGDAHPDTLMSKKMLMLAVTPKTPGWSSDEGDRFYGVEMHFDALTGQTRRFSIEDLDPFSLWSDIDIAIWEHEHGGIHHAMLHFGLTQMRIRRYLSP